MYFFSFFFHDRSVHKNFTSAFMFKQYHMQFYSFLFNEQHQLVSIILKYYCTVQFILWNALYEVNCQILLPVMHV